MGYLVGLADRAKVCFGICNEQRGASEYVSDFGQPLIDSLVKLGPEEMVLDLGAGSARFGRQLFKGEPMEPVYFQLLEDYDHIGREMAIPIYSRYDLPKVDQGKLDDFQKLPADKKPTFVGVARRVPKGVETSDRFRLLGGDWDGAKDPVHEQLKELPQAAIILDEFGILSYTTKPGEYLKFVFDKLKTGGSYFLNHSEMHLFVSYRGRRMGIKKFFEQIPGLEVKRVTVVGKDQESGKSKDIDGALQIIKTGEVTLPDVHLGPGVPLHQGVSFRLFLAEDRPSN